MMIINSKKLFKAIAIGILFGFFFCLISYVWIIGNKNTNKQLNTIFTLSFSFGLLTGFISSLINDNLHYFSTRSLKIIGIIFKILLNIVYAIIMGIIISFLFAQLIFTATILFEFKHNNTVLIISSIIGFVSGVSLYLTYIFYRPKINEHI